MTRIRTAVPFSLLLLSVCLPTYHAQWRSTLTCCSISLGTCQRAYGLLAAGPASTALTRNPASLRRSSCRGTNVRWQRLYYATTLCSYGPHDAAHSAQSTRVRDVLPTRTLANGMALTCCSLARANRLTHINFSCVRWACIVLSCEVCRCPLNPHRD